MAVLHSDPVALVALALLFISCGPPRSGGAVHAPARVDSSAVPATTPFFAGTVRGPGGAPVANAQVCAHPRSPELATAALREPTCVRTGVDGRYHLTGLLGAFHALHADAPGLVPAVYTEGEGATRRSIVMLPASGLRGDIDSLAVPAATRVTLSETPVRLTITLPETTEVRGVLRDGAGHGIDHAMVMLAGSSDPQHVLAADDGSFVFPRVAPGEYRLQARRHGQVLLGKDAAGDLVRVTPGVVHGVAPIRDAPVHPITGVVRGPDGMPLPGAFIVVRGRALNHLTAPVRADAAGRFATAALSPGAYTVRAYKLGGGEAIAEKTRAGSDIVLTLAVPPS